MMFCTIGRMYDENSEIFKNLKDTLELRERDLKLIPLKKQRVIHSEHGVTVEQTDLTQDDQPGILWRSVCVEGQIDNIVKFLQRRVVVAGEEMNLGEHLTSLAEHGRPCGYPEFVDGLQEAM